jgi:RNA polymerase sigma factor (sigma-70 family)
VASLAQHRRMRILLMGTRHFGPVVTCTHVTVDLPAGCDTVEVVPIEPYATPTLAFEGWYRTAHPDVVTTVTLGCGSLELATEATDEAFARALAQWSRVGYMQSPTGWVIVVAFNVARRRARRQAIETRLLRRSRPVVDLPAPAGEVFDAVRQLPPQQRSIVLMRYVADLSQVEIADVLKVSRSTVSSTLTTAHRRLAAMLSDDALPEADRP